MKSKKTSKKISSNGMDSKKTSKKISSNGMTDEMKIKIAQAVLILSSLGIYGYVYKDIYKQFYDSMKNKYPEILGRKNS
jgi:hypothetical protein